MLQLLIAFGVDLTEAQHAALLVVATPLFTALVCFVEDNSGFPAVLKGPASSGQNPAPGPGGGNPAGGD